MSDLLNTLSSVVGCFMGAVLGEIYYYKCIRPWLERNSK